MDDQESFGEFDKTDQGPEVQGREKGSKVLRHIPTSAAAIFLIITLLNISGIRAFFFYSRTSPDIEERRQESVLSAEVLSVPLKIFLIQNDKLGSERSEEDVRRFVENAARVWEQADIELSIKEIITLNLSDVEVNSFLGNPAIFILNTKGYDSETVNVFLLRSLGRINGIAFTNIGSVAVADYTTVYDFRALAHEVGHILGLSHIEGDRGQLMYQGANGVELSVSEIMQAREEAANFFGAS